MCKKDISNLSRFNKHFDESLAAFIEREAAELFIEACEAKLEMTFEEAKKIVKEKLLLRLKLPTIIELNNAEEIYNFAKKELINREQLADLAAAIIRTENAKYIYLFAKDIKNAPVYKLAMALIRINNVNYMLEFLKNVPNAPFKELIMGIIDSNDVDNIYKLLDISGVPIEEIVKAIISIGDSKKILDLYHFLRKKQDNYVFTHKKDPITFTFDEKKPLKRKEIISKLKILLNSLEEAIINREDSRCIYELAEVNQFNFELIKKLASAMSNTNSCEYICVFINLIEKINLLENEKEVIIYSLIKSLISLKSFNYVKKVLQNSKYKKFVLINDIMDTNDINFIKDCVENKIITIEDIDNLYKEAIDYQNIKVLISLICNFYDYIPLLDAIEFVLKTNNGEHIYSLSQQVMILCSNGNYSFIHALGEAPLEFFTRAIINTNDLKYIKLFRDNNPYADKFLLNKAIKDIEGSKLDYSFKHNPSGPREVPAIGIIRKK